MNCGESIAESVQYINDHLCDELSLDTLAARAGFSPYHYCRLFALYAGMPVMEYVRRRRLAKAAAELWSGKRIIDLALDYGFESHNGFSKAFRRVYGYSPDEYRKRIEPHRPPAPNPLAGLEIPDRQLSPQVRIEQREGFYIAGEILHTSAEPFALSQMPALWDMSMMEEIDNRMYAMARPKAHGEYNICFPVHDGLFRHVTGVRVESPEQVEGPLYIDWVPPGLYGVFSPPPTSANPSEFRVDILNTWKYIYSQWLPDSGYELNPNGLDYEFYDERNHAPGPYTMDICVPLVKK